MLCFCWWRYWEIIVEDSCCWGPSHWRFRSSCWFGFGVFWVCSAVSMTRKTLSFSVKVFLVLTSHHVFGSQSYFHRASSSTTIFWPLDFTVALYHWVDHRGGSGRAEGLNIWMQNTDAISEMWDVIAKKRKTYINGWSGGLCVFFFLTLSNHITSF